MNGLPHLVADSTEEALVPVVFVHAFPLSHEMWRPQLTGLAGKARRIAYDIRGHGATGPGDGQFTMETLAEDLIGLLDALQLRSAVLCGLSMGGYIALRAAEKAPTRVRGLVLADTRSEADTDAGKVKRSADIAAVKRDGAAAFAERMAPALFAPANIRELPDTVASVKRLMSANTPAGIAGALLALLSRTDTTASLEKLAVPSLVLVGDQDAITPPAQARAMASRIPGAELEFIAGAGHLSNLERPDDFTRRVAVFLEKHFR